MKGLLSIVVDPCSHEKERGKRAMITRQRHRTSMSFAGLIGWSVHHIFTSTACTERRLFRARELASDFLPIV